jgi:ABC-2 type transport system permease protein
MRIILILMKKEFLQILRNKGLLPIIFLMPIIQLLVLGNAATYDVKNTNFSVIDNNKSTLSRQIVSHLEHNKYFTFVSNEYYVKKGIELLKTNKADFVLVIDKDFEKDIQRNSKGKIQLLIDAVDGASAGIILSYVQEILKDFQVSVIEEKIGTNHEQIGGFSISRNWYNPQLNYIWFMVPGIIVFLITLIGVFVNSMNIAREKELGTIEQLNVTPLKKTQFIAGKLIPLWLIGMMELAFGLLISKFVYHIPILGSLETIFLFGGIYLISMLSLGLIISSNSDTQQQAMFVAYFIMMIFIFLSGLFTPIASMPKWAQVLAHIIPISYYIEVMRNTVLKGSSIAQQIKPLLILTGYATATLSFSIWKYKKTK